MSLGSGARVYGKDPLRHLKTGLIVSVALVVGAPWRAAFLLKRRISWGYVRAASNYSHAVQKCCDCVERSLDRSIRTADLAGYTEY